MIAPLFLSFDIREESDIGLCGGQVYSHSVMELGYLVSWLTMMVQMSGKTAIMDNKIRDFRFRKAFRTYIVRLDTSQSEKAHMSEPDIPKGPEENLYLCSLFLFHIQEMSMWWELRREMYARLIENPLWVTK